MKSKLFITGASGFVARHVLLQMRAREFDRVICMSRRPFLASIEGVECIQGDLTDAGTYRHALASVDTVLHLAAATGNAPAAEHFRTNTDGTVALLRECEEAGVRQFLYVSSIAARFRDVRHYPYAQSKQRAEQAVRLSGLCYTIVRPTIVLGGESALGARLQALADAMVTPMIGPGSARVQPIHVADLAEALLEIIRADRFNGEVLELGGPEVLTIEELLVRMHEARYGNKPRVVHVPHAPLQMLLSALERTSMRLPVTAGQLASFVQDGVAETNDLMTREQPRMKTIHDMLAPSDG